MSTFTFKSTSFASTQLSTTNLLVSFLNDSASHAGVSVRLNGESTTLASYLTDLGYFFGDVAISVGSQVYLLTLSKTEFNVLLVVDGFGIVRAKAEIALPEINVDLAA